MAVPRLIVGLGNPGPEHAGDRHNAGFWLVDKWLDRRGVGMRPESKFAGAVAKTGLAGAGSGDCWVLKPANPDYPDIVAQESLEIIGVVVGVFRRL